MGRRIATVAGVALLCGAIAPTVRTATPPQNAIVRENALPGATDWQRTVGGDIEVYGTQIGGLPGDSIDLHVSTAFRYRIVVYRLGWYGGAGARQVACLPSCGSDEQGRLQPAPPSQPPPAMGPPIRAGWSVTDALPTDPSWTSGYYLVEAVLTTGPSAGKMATTFFILREPAGATSSEILVQVPVNTWEAYNSWGGRSLYPFTGQRMYVVSFERPFGYLAQSPFWWEVQLVRFLERDGYDVSYQTDVDTDADPSSLLRHRLVVVAGHDEYWTQGIRGAFDTALADGTNLAFMGANVGYWNIDYQDNDQSIFSYKSMLDPNPIVAQKTAMWREIGHPECMLTAVEQQSIAPQSHPLDYTVTPAGAADPWLDGTGLNAGDTVSGIVGREHDVINPWPDSCIHPGLTVLFHYDGHGVDQPADAIRYTAPSGARVFASGAMQFSWALDDWRSMGTVGPPVAVTSDRVVPADTRIQQFMRNALDDLTRPEAPQGMTVTQSATGLTVSVTTSSDPRARGFVARVRTDSGWTPLCRGTVTCTGRLPARGTFVVGAVALDAWDRTSAADYATATVHS
jgi:N,N-dimethylformamidase beta subunit-like, C-terminal